MSINSSGYRYSSGGAIVWLIANGNKQIGRDQHSIESIILHKMLVRHDMGKSEKKEKKNMKKKQESVICNH